MSEAPKARLVIDGEEYTLQFNREAVRMLESAGQSPTSTGAEDAPMSLFTAMFHAALRMHHRTTPQKAQALFDKAIDEGYDFGDISEVLMKLYEAVFTPPAREDGTAKPKLSVVGLDNEPKATE